MVKVVLFGERVEEERLPGSAKAPSSDDPTQIRQLQHPLEWCWDLLHQRRAGHRFGDDLDAAAVRDASTVEGDAG